MQEQQNKCLHWKLPNYLPLCCQVEWVEAKQADEATEQVRQQFVH
jgi:hypothetical protein